MTRFPARLLAAGSAAAAALALSACGDGGGNDLNQVAAASENTPLPQVPAPNNGDWAQTIAATQEGGYRMGNPDAPVKLIEYASITCPHCAEFSEAAHEELVGQYVKSGQVSWEFRPTMLFPTDPGVFLMLRCQGPQPFFALTEQLYANQSEWAGRVQAQADSINAVPINQRVAAMVRAGGIDQFFRQRGMPAARVDACLNDTQALQQMLETSQRVAQEDNVGGTPTFLINDQTLGGVDTWAELEPRIRQAIGS